MSLKNLDTDESRSFWEFVERSKREWAQQKPSWVRELEKAEKPSCLNCENLQPFELADDVFTCPSVNIRIHRESAQWFACAMHAPKRQVRCVDCGALYAGFPLDMTLPDEQWRMLLIHPNEPDCILCACCIVRRASKLPGVVAIRARIEFAQPPESSAIPECRDEATSGDCAGDLPLRENKREKR